MTIMKLVAGNHGTKRHSLIRLMMTKEMKLVQPIKKGI